MKIAILYIALIIFSSNPIFSQLLNDGAIITITSGTILYVKGNIENKNAGKIINSGDIQLTGDLINKATLTFNSGSKIIFSGNANSTIISGGAILNNLNMEKIDSNLILGDTVVINGILNFVNSDNKIVLGDKNLVVGASGSILNYDNTKYIITGRSW